MADTESHVGRTTLVDYEEVQRIVELSRDSGDLARIKDTLEPLASVDDRSRTARENLFLYRSLGTLYAELTMDHEAVQCFQQAFQHDSRDRRVLEALASIVLRDPTIDATMPVLNRLLVHHRYDLEPGVVADVYTGIARHQHHLGELKNAEAAYEKALDSRPGDMDVINGLLAVAEAAGDEKAVLAVRERLLTTLQRPEDRAAVLVAIGDDYLSKMNDMPRAMDAYQRALNECETSQPALMRLAEIAIKGEDWKKAVECLSTLGAIVEDDAKKLKFFSQAAIIYRDRLQEHRRAVQTFNKILDIEATQVDAFKGLVALLQDMEAWKELEKNILRMLERLEGLDPRPAQLEAGLLRLLGELRVKQLEDFRGAIESYARLSSMFPDELSFHQILAELYGRYEDTLDEAVNENRRVIELTAGRELAPVHALAGLYHRLERYDEALCIYRVLDYMGQTDEEGKKIVQQFNQAIAPRIQTPFTQDVWDRVRPEYLDSTLVELFTVVHEPLIEPFAHDLDHYGLREKKARLDLGEKTLFSSTYQAILNTLQFTNVPPVYVNPNQQGMINGTLFPPGFLIGEDMLRGRDQREIAFICAKSLVLFRPEFFLSHVCSLRGPKVLKFILFTIIKTFRPDFNLELNRQMQAISKFLKKLHPSQQERCTNLVSKILDDGSPDLDFWVEAIEDTANRVSLLFCDDLPTVKELLAAEESSLGSRDASARISSLLTWAISDEYMELRRFIGLDIESRA